MNYVLKDQTFFSLVLTMKLNFCGTAQLYIRYLISFYRSVINRMLETSRKTIKKEVRIAAGLTSVQELQHNDLGLK